MNPYTLRQIDNNGDVLAEQQVAANDYSGALRLLEDVFDETQRITVYNDDDEIAGQIDVDYWRQKVRRR